MKQIEKIDYLIREYQNNDYTTDTFCNEFISVLYYEKDGSISQKLFNVLDEYAGIFSRFSPYEEDVKHGVLFDECRIQIEFQKLFSMWNQNK